MKFVYVVLNYLSFDDTKECVDSILINNEVDSMKIVIVDNGSNNDSFNCLSQQYAGNDAVDVVETGNNLGFAKGNNYGIKYARKHYDPDFVVVLNNDTIILHKDDQALIEEEYQSSHFAALGPLIFTADGRYNDNPGTSAVWNKVDIKNCIDSCKRDIVIQHLNLWKPYIFGKRIADKIKSYNKSSVQKSYICSLKKVYNVQLHGCYICLSKDFFNLFDGFYDETFLFMEEEILFYLLKINNLTTVFLPSVMIFHKEDSSSNKAWPSNKDRAKNKTRYLLQSAECFDRLQSEIEKGASHDNTCN